MAMKNDAYWKRRMELLEESQLNKGELYLKDLEKQYRIANADIEKEISRWYQRFADNNEISMGEARKLLNSKELTEFKWDVMDYIEYGKKNAINQGWMKELENASAKVHISRLESLKFQMQQQVEVLYGNQLDDIDDLMRKIYSDGYYHTAWEIQKGFNIGYDLQSLNSNQINKVLSRPWSQDKRTFSDRLWTNKQQLIGDLQTNLTQDVITGRKPDELIKGLSNRFQVDRKKAGRLVMTESAAFSSRAQQDAYKALDVERFEIVATLDSHTSEICQDLDGDIFDMKDYEVGVTAPPFHPWCRTVTAPYFDDEFSLGERAARGDDGKVYYVPSNMKYHDWKKSFVDGGSKDGLQVVNIGNIIKESQFNKATTIQEAEEFALDNLNFAADYSKYNLDVANSVNETVLQMQQIFGEDCFEGALHGVGTFPKGYSTRYAGAFAWNSNVEIGDLYLRNVSKKDAIAKLTSVAQQQHQLGNWSTGEALHTVRHELGHALTKAMEQKKIDGKMFTEVNTLRKSIQADVLKAKGGTAMYSQYLSEYGFTNTREFISESIAEYMTGNPRETAQEVVSIILKVIKEGDVT